ncbi:hypothetical protein TM49_04355 [Martelella endophytica]|uniref:Uncharacterized protein n=1 Tax=Martelella endophytica TaxID=1486262 RepID=A0A0D5LLR4_MAREN|nr:hypothetical protein TM49_04355 [Martelella endophytica]
MRIRGQRDRDQNRALGKETAPPFETDRSGTRQFTNGRDKEMMPLMEKLNEGVDGSYPIKT